MIIRERTEHYQTKRDGKRKNHLLEEGGEKVCQVFGDLHVQQTKVEEERETEQNLREENRRMETSEVHRLLMISSSRTCPRKMKRRRRD
jgi:hypothetical protein